MLHTGNCFPAGSQAGPRVYLPHPVGFSLVIGATWLKAESSFFSNFVNWMCAYYGRVEYDIMLSGSKLNVSAPFSKLHSGHGSNATSGLKFILCINLLGTWSSQIKHYFWECYACVSRGYWLTFEFVYWGGQLVLFSMAGCPPLWLRRTEKWGRGDSLCV